MKISQLPAILFAPLAFALVVFSNSQEAFTQEFQSFSLQGTFTPPTESGPVVDRNSFDPWKCSLELPDGDLGGQKLDFNLAVIQTQKWAEGPTSEMGQGVTTVTIVTTPSELQHVQVRQRCFSRGIGRWSLNKVVDVHYSCTLGTSDATICTISEMKDDRNFGASNYLRNGTLRLSLSKIGTSHTFLGTNCSASEKDSAIVRIAGGLRGKSYVENDFTLNVQASDPRPIVLQSSSGLFNGEIAVCGSQISKNRCLSLDIQGAELDLYYNDNYAAKPITVCLDEDPKVVTLTRTQNFNFQSFITSKLLIQRIR